MKGLEWRLRVQWVRGRISVKVPQEQFWKLDCALSLLQSITILTFLDQQNSSSVCRTLPTFD